MISVLWMADDITTFEKVLEKEGFLVYTNKGTSMRPLIKEGRDVLLIKKKDEKLKRNDVVLYKKAEKYILHRIIRIYEGKYVLCGDNRVIPDPAISESDIIGILTGLKRKDKIIDFKSISYRLYLFFWCDLFFIRILYFKLLDIIHSLKRKII